MSEPSFVENAPHVGALLDHLLAARALGHAADVDLDVLDVLMGWALDPVLREHLLRSAEYGRILARVLGCDADHVRVIRWASLLHDIGKIHIACSVLGKCAALTPAETREMQRHALLGAEMVPPLRQGDRIAGIVAAHHERWDGTGYPQGLVGEAIPLGARIVSVVDGFDAMSSDRPYRPALPRHEVVRRMNRGRGTQWQPQIVDALLELLLRGDLDPIVTRWPRTNASRLRRVA